MHLLVDFLFPLLHSVQVPVRLSGWLVAEPSSYYLASCAVIGSAPICPSSSSPSIFRFSPNHVSLSDLLALCISLLTNPKSSHESSDGHALSLLPPLTSDPTVSFPSRYHSSPFSSCLPRIPLYRSRAPLECHLSPTSQPPSFLRIMP